MYTRSRSRLYRQLNYSRDTSVQKYTPRSWVEIGFLTPVEGLGKNGHGPFLVINGQKTSNLGCDIVARKESKIPLKKRVSSRKIRFFLHLERNV